MLLRKIKNKLAGLVIDNTKAVFTSIYQTGAWGSEETTSGPGSTIARTKQFRKDLPALLHSLNITSLLDAPCGDYNWMSMTVLGEVEYTGADIVAELVMKNKKNYPGVNFIIADIIKDPLPYADAVICRDCFIHLTHRQIRKAIRNFKNSGIKYLLTNTYPVTENRDIPTGDYRPLNLELAPFCLPKPVFQINDFIKGQDPRYLGVWDLKKIKI